MYGLSHGRQQNFQLVNLHSPWSESDDRARMHAFKVLWDDLISEYVMVVTWGQLVSASHETLHYAVVLVCVSLCVST